MKIMNKFKQKNTINGYVHVENIPYFKKLSLADNVG